MLSSSNESLGARPGSNSKASTPEKRSFTFVNHVGRSAAEKNDEEDMAIIRSHAMREVRRRRRVDVAAAQEQEQKRARQAISVTPQMATDWGELAVCQFFADFVLPVDDTGDGGGYFPYFHFLPSLYERQAADSYLREAVLAVALYRLANQTQIDDLTLRARRCYGKALAQVNKALQNQSEMKSDQVLATLCLLTKYGVTSCEETAHWDSHEKGQAELLRLRGSEQFTTPTGLAIYRLIYVRQQMNCVAQAAEAPLGSHIQVESVFPATWAGRLMRLISHIATIRNTTRVLLAESQTTQTPVSPTRLREITQEAHSVDAELQAWADWVPSTMRYWTIADTDLAQQRSSPAHQNDEYRPKLVHLFHSMQHASFWAVCWYGRVYLLQTLLDLAQLGPEPAEDNTRPPPTIFQLQQDLQQVVDDICAPIPYLLGEIDDGRLLNHRAKGKAVGAHYVIWSLCAARSVKHVSLAQQRWIQERLLFIGHVQGLRRALLADFARIA